MRTQICTLLLLDLIAVAGLTWMLALPPVEQLEPAAECYTTLLGGNGSPMCPTTIQTFLTTHAAVPVAILVGICLAIAHTRVFLDHRALPERVKGEPLGYDSTRTGMPAAMSANFTCDACGTTDLREEMSESYCTGDEYETQAGWTCARGETYCPICADVRTQTWGEHLQTSETERLEH